MTEMFNSVLMRIGIIVLFICLCCCICCYYICRCLRKV